MLMSKEQGGSPMWQWLGRVVGRKPEPEPGKGPDQPVEAKAAQTAGDDEIARLMALRRARAVKARLDAIRTEYDIPEDR